MNIYRFVSAKDLANVRNFSIIAGTKNFIEENTTFSGNPPSTYKLHQNYPNPFNSSTVIKYSLPEEAYVDIIIYNYLGEVVKRLVDNEIQTRGFYKVYWDGKNENDVEVASGIFFCLINAKESGFHNKIKMLLIK